MDAVIRGTTMPVLEVHLSPGESVVAETGQLGWFDDGIELETTTALAGADGMWDAAKRGFGGGTFFMTRYSATTQAGMVAFPARMPGKIVQVPLGPGRSYLIQQRGFLAGLEGAELTTAFDPHHFGSGVFGGFGFLLQRLEGAGHAWIELAGELSEYDLAPGQSLRVHPAHIGVVEQSVEYKLTTLPGLKNKMFGGDGLILMELTGPGKVWLQSMSLAMLASSLAPYFQTANGAMNGPIKGGPAGGPGLGLAVGGLAVEGIAKLF